jgi:hypothetical protein
LEYTLALRAIYKHSKVETYKDSNINGEFGIYKSGTLSNSSVPIEKAGIIGDGSFNLSTDYEISTKGTSNFSLGSSDFTLSFWFNTEASTGKNTVLLSVANNNSLTTAGTFMLLCNPLRLAIQNNIYIDATETLNLADGKNHFISIVRKGDMFYVFIDGKKEIEDNLETRYKIKDFSFPVTDFAINSGSCNDSDNTPTIKRKMKVDSFSLIQGAGLWTENFTVPSLDVWDGMSQGFLDANGLKHYHEKIVEYINKNSSVRQNNHLYNKDDIVRFNDVWIRCVLGGTTASTPPTLTTEEIGTTITDGGVSWEIIGLLYSSNKILDWNPEKGYNKGEMVYYDNILYRAKANITSGTDFTQEQNNWELVCTQIPEWTSSCYYVQGAIVEYNNKIYKCKTTNSDVAFTESNWTNIGGGSSVEEWKPKKQYNSNDLVINDNKLYLCIQRNMSTQSFEDDSNYWVLLSATEHNNYGQVNKLGAKKGDTFDVSVQKTATFSFPPVEVLKLSGVTKGVSKNIFDYDSGDGKKFTVNNAVANKSKFIIFDGVAKPNNEYKYALSDYTKMTTNYYRVSEEIDPSEFKTFEKVELIE